jgi:hypothetical protein
VEQQPQCASKPALLRLAALAGNPVQGLRVTARFAGAATCTFEKQVHNMILAVL